MANKPQPFIYNLPDEHREAISCGLIVHGKVKVNGFGIFEAKRIPARRGRNPKTGDIVEIKAYWKVKFRPSKNLKELVARNRP